MSGGVTNQELVQKAIISTAALAAQGKLNPAQSDKFIDYIVQETVLKDNARIVRFRNDSLEIDKIGIGRRVALAADEAADPQLRRGISTSKVTLTPKDVMVPFGITDAFKKTNIEGDGGPDHIIQMMAKQLANDLEELYLNGDSIGPAAIESDLKDGYGSTTLYMKDRFLSLQDGWLRQADSGHLVDFAGANIGLSTFGGMIRALPQKWRRDKRGLRFYTSSDLAQLYVEKLSTRATPLGDEATKGIKHTPYGVGLLEVPLMHFQPTITQHLTMTGTTAQALRYKNVSNVVVTPYDLGSVPTAKFVLTTDYTVDAANGTVTRVNGGALSSAQVVKVTYTADPQMILTHYMNFIIGIGQDITIEKDREIYKKLDEYAISCKVAATFEESDAIVKGYNIGTSI